MSQSYEIFERTIREIDSDDVTPHAGHGFIEDVRYPARQKITKVKVSDGYQADRNALVTLLDERSGQDSKS